MNGGRGLLTAVLALAASQGHADALSVSPPAEVATAVAAAASPAPTAQATLSPATVPSPAAPMPTVAATPTVLATEATAPAPARTPTAKATAIPLAITDIAPWNQSGVEFCFGAEALSVFNGSPLSYTPFEIGWRFNNGFHIRSGIDLFYYEGPDVDSQQPAQGTRNYSYNMMDWRTSLLYTVRVPGHLRPLVGVTLDVLRGDRKLAGVDVVDPPQLPAWGFFGTGLELGGEWRLDQNWGVEMLGRYTLSYGSVGGVAGLGLNASYLF